jgi:hypothetical protein
MPIPTPAFSSSDVATECQLTAPWSSNHANVLATLADGALPYSSSELAGRTFPDYVPTAMNWADISAVPDGADAGDSTYAQNANNTLAGINQTITLRISVPSFEVNCTGSGGPSVDGSLDIIKNNTVVATLNKTRSSAGSTTSQANTTITVASGDTLRFATYCSVGAISSTASGGGGGTVSVINQSSGNTVLDTFVFSMSATITV